MIYDFKCPECDIQCTLDMSYAKYESRDGIGFFCPYCAARLERVLSALPFKLEGGGWFSDGY